ncbi:hypothetical protein ACHAPI_012033 [Fusarium lateritium]
MRRARRLQTVDNDELSDYKLGVESMADNIAPRRRGRPRKSQPHKKPSTSKICGSPRESSPQGRPRKTKSHMSDQEIVTILKWKERQSTKMTKRVIDASRAVLRLTGQWPWDLTSDFLPRNWSIPILENLRKLFRTAHRQVATVDYGHNSQVVKRYLQACATKRNAYRLHLKNSDVNDAWRYFSIDNNGSEAVQTTMRGTQIRRVTSLLGSGEDSVEDQDSGDDYEDPSDGDSGSHEVSAEDEWVDWGGYDQFTDDEKTAMESLVTTGKRSRSSSALSRAPKRACTSDVNAAGNDTDGVMNPDEPPSPKRKSRSDSNLTRPKRLADLITTLESLQIEKQKEVDAVTRSLQEITASIQANESSALQASANNKIIDNLCSEVKRYETKREKTLKARKFFQDHHEDMDFSAEVIAKSMQQYAATLEECDQSIAQANAEVLEEREHIAREEFDLKAEERRLHMHHQKTIEEVTHCQTIGILMRLGTSEMTALLTELKGRGINLVGLAEAIMAGSSVAAKEQDSPAEECS